MVRLSNSDRFGPRTTSCSTVQGRCVHGLKVSMLHFAGRSVVDGVSNIVTFVLVRVSQPTASTTG